MNLTPDLREKLARRADRLSRTLANRRARLAELDGAVVNVEITRYPKGGLAPVGRVLEILGRPGEIGVDVEIIIRKHHLPHIFPEEVIAEAQAAPQQVGEADLDGRRDFRDLPIVTIDGETARDFDDAVHVSRPRRHYELQVHIADVAHYVRARSRARSRSAPARHLRLFPESRRAHAARRAFQRHLLAQSRASIAW
jgi:exoribonuclease R